MEMSDSGVFAGYVESLDRWVQVGIASGNVIQVSVFSTEPAEVVDHPYVARLVAVLDGGEPDPFDDIPIALTVSTQERRIFETVRGIPPRQERTVAEVVSRTAVLQPGEDAHRHVREALSGNPVPLLVPDHRVAGIDGATPPDVRRHLRRIEELE